MSGLEQSADRARLYRLLARTLRRPDADTLARMRGEDLAETPGALERLDAPDELRGTAAELLDALAAASPVELAREYDQSFEPWGAAACLPNETAHAPETPQEGLVRTFELADVAGFYRAFGVEVSPASERPDHVAVELEFMHLLAVKQLAAEQGALAEQARICQEAASAFLRDHLGRWCPKLAAALAERAESRVYRLAGELLQGFVAFDADRLDSTTA
jgi:TorA maturation chaperone TorD